MDGEPPRDGRSRRCSRSRSHAGAGCRPTRREATAQHARQIASSLSVCTTTLAFILATSVQIRPPQPPSAPTPPWPTPLAQPQPLPVTPGGIVTPPGAFIEQLGRGGGSSSGGAAPAAAAAPTDDSTLDLPTRAAESEPPPAPAAPAPEHEPQPSTVDCPGCPDTVPDASEMLPVPAKSPAPVPLMQPPPAPAAAVEPTCSAGLQGLQLPPQLPRPPDPPKISQTPAKTHLSRRLSLSPAVELLAAVRTPGTPASALRMRAPRVATVLQQITGTVRIAAATTDVAAATDIH